MYRIKSVGIHLRSLAPGQHSSEETSQRVVVSDLYGPETEPQI